MSEDALWPRASNWLTAGALGEDCDIAMLGVPAFKTSISQTNAHSTPAAVRLALAKYSTWSWTHGVDLRALSFLDFGDSVDPDGSAGEDRTTALVSDIAKTAGLVIAVGGDNSVTFAVARATYGDNIANCGLITFDAHHDLREGISNGSPVRRLIELGLNPKNIVQIGISDFANSPEYALRAMDLGIHVIPRSALRDRKPGEVMREALEVAGAGGGNIHVDIDVDVCDRSVVPACPAAAPGGISADELRQFAYLSALSDRVKSFDITEIDAQADTADQRTVRLAATLILEIATGRF